MIKANETKRKQRPEELHIHAHLFSRRGGPPCMEYARSSTWKKKW